MANSTGVVGKQVKFSDTINAPKGHRCPNYWLFGRL